MSTTHSLKGQTFESPFSNEEAREKLAKLVFAGKARSQSFAAARLAEVEGNRATDLAWAWVHRIVIDHEPKQLAPRPVTAAPASVDLTKIVTMFDHAAQHLKKPAITFAIGDQVVELRRAGDQSRNPGYVYMTNGEPDGKYFGKIDRQGGFTCGRDFTHEAFDLLKQLGQDPVKAAADYGHKTGRCCFCNLKLKDERSTVVGYGPVCAEHYGLPWGDRPVEATPAGDAPKGKRTRVRLKPELAGESTGLLGSEPAIGSKAGLSRRIEERKAADAEQRPASQDDELAAKLANVALTAFGPENGVETIRGLLAAGNLKPAQRAQWTAALKIAEDTVGSAPLKLTGPMVEIPIEQTGGRMSGLPAEFGLFTCVNQLCPEHGSDCGPICPTCKAQARAKGRKVAPKRNGDLPTSRGLEGYRAERSVRSAELQALAGV